MTKYTKFEAIFRNETLVFTDRDPWKNFSRMAAPSGKRNCTS